MSEENLNFSELMDRLQTKANEDGKVTEEETDFLNSIADDVQKFVKSMEAAQQDEFISDDEFHEMIILRDNILSHAMNFNSESEDINSLVQELFEEINKFEIPGMVDDEFIDSEEEPLDD